MTAVARKPFSYHAKSLDQVLMSSNQGTRIARVLAVVGDRALVEYVLPSGITCLAFTLADTTAQVGTAGVAGKGLHPLPYLGRIDLRPCTYRSLLKRWLVAVIQQSGSWRGNSFRGKVPSPQKILAKRMRANKLPKNRKVKI